MCIKSVKIFNSYTRRKGKMVNALAQILIILLNIHSLLFVLECLLYYVLTYIKERWLFLKTKIHVLTYVHLINTLRILHTQT